MQAHPIQAHPIFDEADKELQSSLKVYQSNVLVEATYKLTLNEKRLIVACIGRINPRGQVPDEIIIDAHYFAKSFDLDLKSAYAQLKEASEKLYTRDITYYDEEKNRDVSQRWLEQKSVYRNGDGTVAVVFAKHLHPYLSLFGKNFTGYKISYLSQLTSIHSVRLYELLAQYLKLGRRPFSVTDLRSKLGLTSEYEKFKDFRVFVIEKAVAQIEKNTNIKDIEVSYEKVGRNITKVIFSFSEVKQESLAF